MALKIALAAVVATLMAGVALGFLKAVPVAEPAMDAIKSVTFGANSTSLPAGQAGSPLATVAVEVADTDALREQGLSGRTGLAPNSGMLFVFDKPGMYGFWMKDMLFDLDMIYMDASSTVITVDADATAASYYQSQPTVFYPSSPATYVLEVPAGYAKAHGIKAGVQATLNR